MFLDSNKIKVLVVDDHRLVAEGTASLLSSFNHICIIGIARTGAKCIEWILIHRPDVILLDISLPDICGTELLDKILTMSPHAKVIMLTGHSPQGYFTRAMQQGASGFLLKDCSIKEMVEAIEQVYFGGNYFSKSMAPFIRDVIIGMDVPNLGIVSEQNFTPREREILELMTDGLQNKEISKELGIKIRTVETHVSNILIKLGVSTRLEAVVTLMKANKSSIA